MPSISVCAGRAGAEVQSSGVDLLSILETGPVNEARSGFVNDPATAGRHDRAL
jgi:hypothetical protein